MKRTRKSEAAETKVRIPQRQCRQWGWNRGWGRWEGATQGLGWERGEFSARPGWGQIPP